MFTLSQLAKSIRYEEEGSDYDSEVEQENSAAPNKPAPKAALPKKKVGMAARGEGGLYSQYLQVSASTSTTDEAATCSMASYKRLEAHYRNEQKMRKYIEQMYEEVKRTSDSKSQGDPFLLLFLKIDHLRDSVAADHLLEQLKGTITRLQSENKELQGLVERSERKMKMMQTLTSIEIDIIDDQKTQMSDTDLALTGTPSSQVFCCRVFGKAEPDQADPAIEFEVNLTEASEVEYSPVHVRADVRAHLPEYMAEDIAFEIKEAPVFISRLLEQVAGSAAN